MTVRELAIALLGTPDMDSIVELEVGGPGLILHSVSFGLEVRNDALYLTSEIDDD